MDTSSRRSRFYKIVTNTTKKNRLFYLVCKVVNLEKELLFIFYY